METDMRGYLRLCEITIYCFCLLGITLFYSSFCYAQEDRWKSIYVSNDGSKYFIDNVSIKTNEAIVTVWVKDLPIYGSDAMKEYINRYGDTYEYSKYHSLVNCKNNTYKITEVIHYSNNGKILKQFTEVDAPWQDDVPETFGESLHNVTCK
jgi:surface-adhesin protein E